MKIIKKNILKRILPWELPVIVQLGLINMNHISTNTIKKTLIVRNNK